MTLPLVTLQQVRDAGLAATVVGDDEAETAIQIASEYVERVCGLSFPKASPTLPLQRASSRPNKTNPISVRSISSGALNLT